MTHSAKKVRDRREAETVVATMVVEGMLEKARGVEAEVTAVAEGVVRTALEVQVEFEAEAKAEGRVSRLQTSLGLLVLLRLYGRLHDVYGAKG